MSENHHRLSPLGAGIRRLWSELEVAEGRHINAAALAREAATASGAPVQPGAPWAIVMGRTKAYSTEALGRILSYFNVDLETAEKIGAEEPGWIADA